MPVVAPKKKGSLLPLLTVVFLISYGLMTMLIVEQNEAIQSQQSLIQVLLGDSKELWAMKGKALTDRVSPSSKPGAEAFYPSPVDPRAISIDSDPVNPGPVDPGDHSTIPKAAQAKLQNPTPRFRPCLLRIWEISVEL